MCIVKRINKTIILKYEDKDITLPKKLKDDIEIFWNKSVKENANLYNGQDFAIEKVIETDEKIEMLVVKTNYAHYLYDERVGINDKKYMCNKPWSGILLLTNDNYFVLGEMSTTTSIPHCLQISGGGIDINDIDNGIISIHKNLRRELKEELDLELDEIPYEMEYMECPSDHRHVYGFIAIGKLNKSKLELEQHFEKYKKYLEENNLEIEFDKLLFLSKENALDEFDKIVKKKRPYLRNLIQQVEGITYIKNNLSCTL